MASINTRKRGDKWQYQFEAATIDGKRKQISKSGFRTKKEALEAGTKALAEYNNCGLTFVPSEISFNDYLDYWIKEYAQVNLKETTVDNYNKKIKLYIKPKLGIYKLKSLTPAILQSFINEKFNEGFSRNTLLVLKGILSGSLNYAVEPLGYIKFSPMAAVRLPLKRAVPNTPTRKKEKYIVSEEQMEGIFERFPFGHSSYLPLQLAYRCGLRLGEAFAITWDDIDLKNQKLDINKQVQYKNKQWYFTPPKYDSYRIIDLDNTMIDILKKYKQQQRKDKIYYGELYTELKINDKKQIKETDGTEIHLINIRENGTYIQPRVMQHCFHIIHHKLGIKELDYHSLRHTHATMLLSSGANIKAVQERLGHKKLDMTLDVYTHVTDEMRKNTIDILNKKEQLK
ncbi:site-specific integrase [Clostridium botulinum]|uniref:site-specific integrase n=1 Tax=Clostridium botulinum TaxID=1491 RepID=UPI0013F6C5D5|nr:site-specific integrase [Clostridium botulinum]MBY6915591.1 site-specific integrase [Clostridium botulinum]NFO39862.1 site-specific integrase [Clostridium botulinum]NFO48172.1 site-specific integrase [Clostridium botulinum]NFO86504.1 site-specific integrase [Clostridium botulinum]NFP29651.1 site-specific integrase [Clostridium botulinum]